MKSLQWQTDGTVVAMVVVVVGVVVVVVDVDVDVVVVVASVVVVVVVVGFGGKSSLQNASSQISTGPIGCPIMTGGSIGTTVVQQISTSTAS